MTAIPSAREVLAEIVAAWDTFNGKSIPESLYAAISNARAVLAEPPKDGELTALIHDMRWCAQQLYDGKKGEMLLANAAAKLSLAAARLSAPVPEQPELARRLQSVSDGALTAAPTVRQWCGEAATFMQRHTKAVGDFLRDLYSTMVDPCAEGSMTVAEMQTALMAAAIKQRELLAAPVPRWTKEQLEQIDREAGELLAKGHELPKVDAAPVPAREWIPVGERLPETPLHVGPYSGAHIQRSAEVLMAYGDGLVGAGKYSATRVEGRWYRNSHRVTGITHWMPLPPPPAADK